MKKYRIIPFILMITCSCNADKINSEKDYYRWINDDNHRLFVSRTINGVKLSVKYLPPEFLAFKELKGSHAGKEKIDSLILLYSNSRAFLLTLSIENENQASQPGDILYKDIISPGEYNKRLLELSFNLGQYIKLKTDSNTYVPVLHTFENSYGIGPNRSIYLVFASDDPATDDLMASPKLEFVFEDQLFMTGISYFVFKKDDLDNIPHINFWEK